jgi:hypothetical protein
MLLLNVDGQAIHIRGHLKAEKSEHLFTSYSEAGEGIRYNFRKDVRLKAGPHRIAVAIPGDDIIIVKEVTLLKGSFNLSCVGADLRKNLREAENFILRTDELLPRNERIQSISERPRAVAF